MFDVAGVFTNRLQCPTDILPHLWRTLLFDMLRLPPRPAGTIRMGKKEKGRWPCRATLCQSGISPSDRIELMWW